jgi:hypothetical protein
LQRGDDAELLSARIALLAREGRGAVLEEGVLPGVEERGREPVLLAQVGNGYPVDQVTSADRGLLFPGLADVSCLKPVP